MEVGRLLAAGWARTAVPAGVGAAVASMDLRLTLLVVFVTSAWYLAWATLEVTIDARLGVMLGYACVRPRRWKALRDARAAVGDIDALLDAQAEVLGQVGQQSRHARARARETSLKGQPRLPQPRLPHEVVDVS